MDNFFVFLKALLIALLIGIMPTAFIILGMAFFACNDANERHKSQIIQLNKTIIQQDRMIEESQEDTDRKINQLMILRNKAIKERNQYEKKFKQALSKRVIKNYFCAIALSVEKSATVYECEPID